MGTPKYDFRCASPPCTRPPAPSAQTRLLTPCPPFLSADPGSRAPEALPVGQMCRQSPPETLTFKPRVFLGPGAARVHPGFGAVIPRCYLASFVGVLGLCFSGRSLRISAQEFDLWPEAPSGSFATSLFPAPLCSPSRLIETLSLSLFFFPVP